MLQSRFSRFLLYSLLLHLMLLAFFATILISFHPKPEPLRTETTLTLIAPPPPPPSPVEPVIPPKKTVGFVPTLASQQTTQANPTAQLESEYNTRRTSSSPARNPNSMMPDMRGDPRAGLSYVNSPSAQGETEIESAPAPPTPPTPPAQLPKPPQQKKIAQLNRTTQLIPQPAPPQVYPEDAQPLLPPKPDTSADEEPSPPPQPQVAPRPPPQSSSFSLSKSRSDIHGGGDLEGPDSPEARETELGRYKSKIYRAIGSRWYLNVDVARTDLSLGTVRVKFFIQANGVVTNVEVVEDSGSQLLRTISLKAVLDSAPFEPFSDSLREQLGDGYPEEFTFSIY